MASEEFDFEFDDEELDDEEEILDEDEDEFDDEELDDEEEILDEGEDKFEEEETDSTESNKETDSIESNDASSDKDDKLFDNEKLTAEYDELFTDTERVRNLLKLTSDAYTREFKRIKVRQIGFTDPIKKSRRETMTGLTASIKDFGVLDPIDVMTVENPDDDYQYILISGLRRVFGALKNGQTEIDAIVWDFKDKDKGMDLALYIGLMLNRTQKRHWAETWHLYQVLELQSNVTPGTLEYLLQLESGDAMKLKDVMLCNYDEVKEALLSGDKTLDACYKMLAKLRKEEDRLAMDDETGAEESGVDEAKEVASDNTGEQGQLSDQDVMELLEMADNLDDIDDVSDDDFKEMNESEFGAEQQKVGDRHPLDPALRNAVLARDDFTCTCCGMKMVGARLGLIAIHHILPVHVGGKDAIQNLTTLCVNDHLCLHIMERNGGSIMMSKEDFDAMEERDKVALKKARKLAMVAIEADKRKGMSKDDIQEATRSAITHPMPGVGLKENQQSYEVAEQSKRLNASKEES